jgi:O-glycosyl hydrolase
MVILGCGGDPVEDHAIDVAGYPLCTSGKGSTLVASDTPGLEVTVDVNASRQTMRGFGASDCWSIQHVGRWPIEKREAIADLLFETGLDPAGSPRGIGLTVWRFNIGAGSSRRDHISREWRKADTFLSEDFTDYDWDRLPGQRWFLEAAANRGVERFIAFVNSPPITMTSNGRAYCDSSSGSTNLAAGREEDFAAFLADVIQHFREVEGIEFDTLSPFNEPQWDWEEGTQEGCRYSVADMKRVIDALATESGLGDTRIEIPESGSLLDLWRGERYLQAFFETNSDAYVGEAVAQTIAGHSYKTDLPETGLVESRRALRQALDSYPGLGFSMTEFCVLGEHGVGRDLGIDTALHVARLIHFDLTLAGASSWQWWLAVSPYDYKDGLIYIDKDESDGEFSESKLLWVMGNFSRFVRPGMVRIEIRRSDAATHEDTVEGLMASSFFDPYRGIITTVVVNFSQHGSPVKLMVEGAKVDRWVPYVTDAINNLSAFESVPVNRTVTIPAWSVVTLVGKARA